MDTASLGAIISVVLAAGGVAKATGGMVIPGHDFTGAVIVFGVAILFLLAGWLLRGWGAVTSADVMLMLHRELKEFRSELGAWKDEQRNINEELRHCIEQKQDRQ
jgi:hypothetical protein